MFRQTIYIVRQAIEETYMATEWENVRAFTIKEKAEQFLNEHNKGKRDWDIDEIILERG